MRVKLNGVTIEFDITLLSKISNLFHDEDVNHAMLEYKECVKAQKTCAKPDIPKYKGLQEEMERHISTKLFGTKCGKPPLTCAELVADWDRESQSTIYWVRFICYSIVTTDEVVVHIERWDDLWEKCVAKIVFPDKPRRVIMGLGPSGCGKSTIAKSIFPLFGLTTVVFIDGGISRETSLVWNIATIFNNSQGISDLYSHFRKNSSKDELFKMLKPNVCSFYVPETVSTLSGKISKYTSLDKNWVGLLIWQHLNHGMLHGMFHHECDFPSLYKCVGCDISGHKREVLEGKKYDSWAYDLSIFNSMKALKKCSYKFVIHNSGSKDSPTVIAYDTPGTYTVPNAVMIPMSLSGLSFEKIKSKMREKLKNGGRRRTKRA